MTVIAEPGLTEATVKSYVSRILTKLGCGDNRTQAGLMAHTARDPHSHSF